ncbi:MAG: cell division protein FtsZ [Crocinitomicaceae bacterium]|nr:cell division protein FtsZ [Crocinitomicaceae bacterium]
MEFDLPTNISSIIKVIGVGGGGSNAVNHMYDLGIKGVDFIVCNTDKQALDVSSVPFKIQLGTSLTEGNGAGAIPEIGKNAAIENIDEIREVLSKNTKMVFVTAGMGGGTGTGAAPVIASIARELGILTVGIVTVPFGFEGRKRRQQAEEGLEQMRQSVDTLLVINNEKLRELTGNLTISNAFSKADDVLAVAAKGIAELISVTGSVNVDFNDVNTVMKDSGVAIMGSAAVDGEDRAIRCVQDAMNSPLLNDNNIHGAKYVLLNITYGDKEVEMNEITEITDYIQDEAGSTADVIWGHGYDPTLGDKLCVTLIATGFKTSPITGFEKAPEKIVKPLNEEPIREINKPLDSPTQSTVVEVRNEYDPYIKQSPTVANNVTPVTPVQVVESVSKPIEPVIEKAPTNLEWDMSTPTNVFKEVEDNTLFVETKSESKQNTPDTTTKIVHTIGTDDVYNVQVTDKQSSSKAGLTAEEHQKLYNERMERLHLNNQRLKSADGLSQLESEPAFKRRNISLDFSKPSTESSNSRYGVSGNGGTLRSNNSFLHDNVD